MKRQELRIHQKGDPDTLKDRYLTFWADNRLLGLSITCVVQIVGLQRITHFPDSPAYVKGMVSLRGDVFPVVDLCQKLGGDAKDYNDRNCIIITKISNSLYGFIVDGVEAVCQVLQKEILPVSYFNNESLNDCFSGIVKVPTESTLEKIIFLLNIQKLLSKEEFEVLALAER